MLGLWAMPLHLAKFYPVCNGASVQNYGSQRDIQMLTHNDYFCMIGIHHHTYPSFGMASGALFPLPGLTLAGEEPLQEPFPAFRLCTITSSSPEVSLNS